MGFLHQRHKADSASRMYSEATAGLICQALVAHLISRGPESSVDVARVQATSIIILAELSLRNGDA
jgi:hypothetical protein